MSSRCGRLLAEEGGRDGGSELDDLSACFCLSSFDTRCLLNTFALSSSGMSSKSKAGGVSEPWAGVSGRRALMPPMTGGRRLGVAERLGTGRGDGALAGVPSPRGGIFGGGVPA